MEKESLYTVLSGDKDTHITLKYINGWLRGLTIYKRYTNDTDKQHTCGIYYDISTQEQRDIFIDLFITTAAHLKAFNQRRENDNGGRNS